MSKFQAICCLLWTSRRSRGWDHLTTTR